MITETAMNDDSVPKTPKEKPRKERVLHTRIPALLEQDLKTVAESLRVPVSNLVRTILEDAIAAADRAGERVESGLQRAAKTVHDESERLAERVESGLNRAARVMQSERDRLAEKIEAEVDRVDNESERFAAKVGEAVERAARTVQGESNKIAERVEELRRAALQVAQRKNDEPAARRVEALEGIVAFQPVVVAIETACASCDRRLMPGDDAALGIGGDASQRVFVCGDCLPKKTGK
jgi:RNase P subunit RPR2